MMLGFDLKTWLQFAFVGAVVSTVGALLGIFLKDFLFARSFESWKQNKTLEQLYQRYRDPLSLSAYELATRLSEIDDQYPTVYLQSSVLASSPHRKIHNSIDDPYFKKQRLLSSIYRLAAFLGWLELYRQEVTYLRSGNNTDSKALELAVNRIRSDLADGQINKADDWHEWRDTLIFREELRAIGEAMIEIRGIARTVIGYGRFLEAVGATTESSIKRWFPVVSNFLLDLETERRDFRRVRIRRLFIHLVDLMNLLEATSVEEWLIEKRNSRFAEIFPS
ncbi:MAG: hypothetical protein ACJ8HJ_22145 [Massilia sp.]